MCAVVDYGKRGRHKVENIITLVKLLFILPTPISQHEIILHYQSYPSPFLAQLDFHHIGCMIFKWTMLCHEPTPFFHYFKEGTVSQSSGD